MYGRDLIEALVRTYQLRPPVDVDRICQGEGIDVSEADLPDGFIAVYDGRVRRFPLIITRRGITTERRRQAIAHELRHHFFDEGGLYNLNDYFRSSKDYKAERFAKYLLVSDWEIRLFAHAHPRLGEKDAAAHFGVDLTFLRQRMDIYKRERFEQNLSGYNFY